MNPIVKKAIENNWTIGKTIYELFKQSNLGVCELERRSHLSHSTISRMVTPNSTYRFNDLDMMCKLILGLSNSATNLDKADLQALIYMSVDANFYEAFEIVNSPSFANKRDWVDEEFWGRLNDQLSTPFNE